MLSCEWLSWRPHLMQVLVSLQNFNPASEAIIVSKLRMATDFVVRAISGRCLHKFTPDSTNLERSVASLIGQSARYRSCRTPAGKNWRPTLVYSAWLNRDSDFPISPILRSRSSTSSLLPRGSPGKNPLPAVSLFFLPTLRQPLGTTSQHLSCYTSRLTALGFFARYW
ncbi:hypothetical protein VTI28DRAFT_7264 [Corynascus sepedonium]